MTLIAIILATLASGIGSVWLAAFLLRRRRGGDDSVGPQHLLSLAAGALLATAFMHLLPEAFESQASAHELFATLLVGVVFFFLLEKAELWPTAMSTTTTTTTTAIMGTRMGTATVPVRVWAAGRC